MAGLICNWPPGTDQTGPDGCHFGFRVSIVATRQSVEGRGAARGVLSAGSGPGVNGGKEKAGRGCRNGWKVTGGHKKLSFIQMYVERELRRKRKMTKDGGGVMFE